MTKAERKRLQAEERKAQASFELKQEVYGDVEGKQMKNRVHTDEYKNTWGKNPKGFGMWMFYRLLNQRLVLVSINSGEFSQCKNEALKVANEMGVNEIFVGA